MKAILYILLGIIGFVLWLYIALAISYGDLKTQNDTLVIENTKLQWENFDLKNKASQYDTLNSQLSSIRSKGYKPDTLLVFAIEQKLNQYPSLKRDSVYQVAAKETDYGYNRREGIFGEKGWSQIKPGTLKYFISLLGGDTTNFNINDYKDVKTHTEWAFVMFFYSKMNRNNLSWQEWNNGKFMKRSK